LLLLLNMLPWPTQNQPTLGYFKNDYLNDRLNAQRTLSLISLMIPLGLFLLYLIAPHASDSGSEVIVISVSTVVIFIAGGRSYWNWHTPRDDKYQLSCSILDFLSAAAILVSYSLSYNIPMSIALKSPTANIFFIYLASRILLFKGRIMFQTGMIAASTWIGLVLLALYEPGSLGRTSSYVEYLTGFKVLLGAEVERVFQFGILTTVLYSYIYFARRDSTTGFLRRANFTQGILKFLSQNKSITEDEKYALVEIRVTDAVGERSTYDKLFKELANANSFEDISFKRFGRLTLQSAAVWFDYSKSKFSLPEIVENLHLELSVLTVSKLRSKTPVFVIGATHLDSDNKSQNPSYFTDMAIREAIKDNKKYRVFDVELENKIKFKKAIEDNIKHGLQEDLFSVAYQPIVDFMTDKPVGFEALIRLKTSEGEIISPNVFIPVAEELGLIDNITDYLCERVSLEGELIRSFFVTDDLDPYININISPLQLKDVSRCRNY